MAMVKKDQSLQLLEGEAHIWNQVLNYINSMSLKCAIQLGIPEIIHKHGRPMTLLQLVHSLQIDNTKAEFIGRLMRILIHSGFFQLQNDEQENSGYLLTPATLLLVEDNPLNIKPIVLSLLDPILTDPFHHLSKWLKNKDDCATFDMVHGMPFWEQKAHNIRFGHCFDEGMSSDSLVVANVINEDCRQVFEGLHSLVDVGGGTGSLAKAIAEAFPQIDCTVLDLASVVEGLQGTKNLKYVQGDMFDYVPPADAVLLKWILHYWSDEKCIQVLKKCKEAITSKEKPGKIIIIEMIVSEQKSDHTSLETQLLFDMLMMSVIAGRERNEKEWAKLFVDAGFSNYKITSLKELRSIIEVYP